LEIFREKIGKKQLEIKLRKSNKEAEGLKKRKRGVVYLGSKSRIVEKGNKEF